MKGRKKKRRILILAANPGGSSRLRLDKEVREIEDGLRLAKHREKFEIRTWWAVRDKDIRRAMLEYEPNIVHFCGHGEKEGLMVEDDSGKAVLIQLEALAGLFEFFANSVECVVLNARYSRLQARAISRHIDFVIGISSEIADTAAVRFAQGFYDALGAGKSYEEAFKFGRHAILMGENNLPESMAPVFYARQYTTVPPPPGVKKVCLFYSHEDKTLYAEPLASGMKKYGVDVCSDEGAIFPGDSLVEKISKSIGECEYVVVLLTPNSIDSSWVNDELEQAFEQFAEEERGIIPAIFGACVVPEFLKAFLYIDFRKFFGYGLKELLWTVGVESRLLSEAETRKLLLNMLNPGYREHAKKYVLVKDNSREEALKEAKRENLKYLIVGVVLFVYFMTWHALWLVPIFGGMAALAANFAVLFLAALSAAKYTHPKFAVERYFKLLSRFDALIKDGGSRLRDPAVLYYELLGKHDKRFYKKHGIHEKDVGHLLEKCNRRYLIYAVLLVGILILLTIYGSTLPKELKKTLTSLQAIVVVWGFFVYTLYTGKVKEIREMYNLKRDFERLSNVFTARDN